MRYKHKYLSHGAGLRWVRSVVLVGFIVMVAAGCRPPEPTDDVVAEVGDSEITERGFVDSYVRYILKTGVHDSEAERRKYLDGMINKLLLVDHARRNDLIGTDAANAAEARLREKLLLDAYTVEVVYAAIEITEANLREMFARMNTSVTARHLYANTLDEAKRLRHRLSAGESFEELAREIFADPELADNGGLVGTFGFDEMDPAFEEVAFEIEVGTVSEPVQTAQGYSIIRVDDRFTNPLITESEFNERRHDVAQYVRYRKRLAARRDHVRALVSSLDLELLEPGFTQLTRQITEPAGLGESERLELGPADLVSFGPPNERSLWSVSDFRERAASTTAEQRAAVTDSASLRRFIDGLVGRDRMIERALELELDGTATYRSGFEAARNDWAYEHFRERFRKQIEVPDDSIAAYFERFSHEFTDPEKVRVWEILLESKREADEMLALSESARFEDLAADRSTREGATMTGGDLGYVTRDQLGVLAGPVFSASEGEILGPVEVAGRYAILKVGDRRPTRPLSLAEASDLIEERLLPIMERRGLVEIVQRAKGYTRITIDWPAVYSAPLSSTSND